jgi:diguanylate cyclase (GGDEF)-like protein
VSPILTGDASQLSVKFSILRLQELLSSSRSEHRRGRLPIMIKFKKSVFKTKLIIVKMEFKRNRPTIGILPGWSGLAGIIPDRYLASVLTGIQSAAHLRECHLLLAWGLGRVTDSSGTYPAWPVTSSDSDFVPVGPWNADGLIVFAPLRHEERSRYLQELSNEGYPILFIATGEQGPMISVDNEAGIRQAVAHMADHGHRRIAFIAGDPNDKGDSEIRLHAYHSAIRDYGLDIDSGLVIHGWHTFSGGYEATRKLIDSRLRFTAVVASDDNSATGAMKAIRDAGLQIPRDIAIIGFDDQPDAVAQVPPLASIHVPLTLIGEQALTLMFDHITMHRRLESVRIPTRLVPRQSCGCMPQVVSSAGKGESQYRALARHLKSQDYEIHSLRQQLAEEMIATLPPSSRFPHGERTNRLCTNLVEAFYRSLNEENTVHFQGTLMEFLHELEMADDNMDPWQEIVSALRRSMTQLPVKWRQARIQRLAQDMLHQARAAISESAQRQDYRHQYQREITSQALSELTARLSATLDKRQAVEVLDAHLTAIGIRHVRVALFEPEGDDPVAWSVLLDPDPELVSQRFATRDFPPPTLYPLDELLNLALVPLVFQEERLGYMAFDAGNLGPCAILARQLAATFKASDLHAQVVELSLTDALTSIYNRRYFDLFLSNEVERSRRFGRDLAVLMIDIDYFKEYNDTFGHPAGDQALQSVVMCLQKGRRSADVLTRIGGDEFALILPETEMTGALEVAERIRAAMTVSADFKHRLTLSMGISTLRGNNIEADMLIQQADIALYEAKRTGRDRICIFEGKNSVNETGLL